MPNSASAKKRVRQNVKRQSLNNWRKRRLKAQTRQFLEAVQAGKTTEAETEFRLTCGLLDKIATTSTMHKNTAARRKSRLSRHLRELKRKAS